MKIDIICPLYQGESYIAALHASLLKQKQVEIGEIRYVLTESSDQTETYLKNHHLNYEKIMKSEFSHSVVREQQVFKSTADIICFISQDIVIEDELWLYHLTKDIISGKVEAGYSRQLTKYDNIEKYTRENNYPNESRIQSKKELDTLGMKAFFFSDAASAIRRDIFVKLNGYDQLHLPINEDMYFAYKLITNGYKIKYCADSVVFHSHQFKLRELYERYKLTGIFLKENTYLDKYGTTSSGNSMAKYVLKRALEDRNLKVLVRYPFDMAARLFGMKAGKRI